MTFLKQSEQVSDGEEKASLSDNRICLASAVAGINLRKVQQQEDQTRRKSTSKLDVQSIMEAAFEMRRRVMEEPDSSEEECIESDEDEWG